MTKLQKQSHMTDVLFTLALFCTFAVSAVLVMIFGANVYRATAANMDDNYTKRISLSYIANQVRQHDENGAVSLGRVEYQTALCLTESAQSDYVMYIYFYDGAIRELYCDKNMAVKARDGIAIVEVAYLDLTLNDDLLTVLVEDQKGETAELTLSLRAGGGQ